MTDYGLDSTAVDPEYDRHGGFPVYEAADAGPGFERFLVAMRRAQELAVCANPDRDVWETAPTRSRNWWTMLEPHRAAEGEGPANRSPDLPERAAC